MVSPGQRAGACTWIFRLHLFTPLFFLIYSYSSGFAYDCRRKLLFFIILFFFQFFETDFCEAQTGPGSYNVAKDDLELLHRSAGVTEAHHPPTLCSVGALSSFLFLPLGLIHLTRRKLNEKRLFLAHSSRAPFHHVGEDAAAGPRG